MAALSTSIHIRLTASHHRLIVDLAENNDTTISKIIRNLIHNGLINEQKKGTIQYFQTQSRDQRGY